MKGELAEIEKVVHFAFAQLTETWEGTRCHWLDPVSNRFEQGFWREIEGTVPEFLSALEHLGREVDRILES